MNLLKEASNEISEKDNDDIVKVDKLPTSNKKSPENDTHRKVDPDEN